MGSFYHAREIVLSPYRLQFAGEGGSLHRRLAAILCHRRASRGCRWGRGRHYVGMVAYARYLFRLPMTRPYAYGERRVSSRDERREDDYLRAEVNDPQELEGRAGRGPGYEESARPPGRRGVVPPNSIAALGFLPRVRVCLLCRFL